MKTKITRKAEMLCFLKYRNDTANKDWQVRGNESRAENSVSEGQNQKLSV